MEATSGLQRRLVLALSKKEFKVFVLNPEHVWAYRRSLGKRAKTDKIDSRLIAEMPELLKPAVSNKYSDVQNELKELSSRRKQYSQMIAKEKTRIKRTISKAVKQDILDNIKELKSKMLKINNAIKNAIENKQAASLVGVAPVIRESGMYKGASKIHGGRNNVRSIMYMAAFSAMRFNKKLKEFAEKLKAKGKPYKVIIVAVMRKLIVIANSMLKNNTPWSDSFA